MEGVRRKGKREVEDQTKVRKGDTKKREREGGREVEDHTKRGLKKGGSRKTEREEETGNN